ncbi:MAG: hypothetical protein C0622_11590 [Desulfuromonas sp.]|nr:MAG: hypothetical protein C0622_11590 [Desulfuromonas sp.]
MKSLKKILKRHKELKLNLARVAEIEQAMTQHLGVSVRLKPAAGKAGQDQIYRAFNGREAFAMVRVENRNRELPGGPAKWSFRQRLDLAQRLEAEWRAYEKLSAIALAPQPLWRNDVAMACSLIVAERGAKRFIGVGQDFWMLAEMVFSGVQKMHDCDITHMDLNLGNVLIDEKAGRLSFIDFEFTAADWVSPAQQRICDYFILINEFCRKRRGGNVMLGEPEKMAELLLRYLREEDRKAALGKLFPQFERLSREEGLREQLRTVFPGLDKV